MYVPGLAANLCSAKAATEMGRTVHFRKNRCWIKDVNGYTMAIGSVVGRMFRLDCESIADTAAITGSGWHQRLNHVNQQTLKQMSMDKDNDIRTDNGLSFCEYRENLHVVYMIRLVTFEQRTALSLFILIFVQWRLNP